MRYRLMATYRGAPYEAGIGPADGEIVLFAACPPPEELGFEPATGHWRKELRIQDVQAVWQSRPVGMFRGDRCIILDDLGDRLHIGFLGHDAYRAEQLGYWQVDRGVFELVAVRDEVMDIVEERTDYPYPPAAVPQAGYPASAGPAEPGYAPQAGPAAYDYQADYQTPAGLAEPGRMPPSDGGVALPPPAAGPPLPLEAEALRAASAASRRDLVDPATGPVPIPQAAPTSPEASAPVTLAYPAAPPPEGMGESSRRQRSAGRRMATERIFGELASLASIPAASYSVGEEVDGAMCLLETADGFEVFTSTGGSRHEVRVFSDEESACFYLFGVLAADAVRTGVLIPGHGRMPAGASGSNGVPQ